MSDTSKLNCERALEIITGPLSAELNIRRVGSVARSKVQLFEFGASGGRQFGLVVGDMFAAENPKAPQQTRILVEKCNEPGIPGVMVCTDDYNGSRINQADSKLAPPNQSSFLVADETALVSVLKWYAAGSTKMVNDHSSSDLAALVRTRIEKAAQDAGFDLSGPADGDWLVFRSSAFPQKVGVLSQAGKEYRVGLPDSAIGEQLCSEFELVAIEGSGLWPMIIGGISEYQTLHRLLLRTAAICRAMACSGLKEFEEKNRKLPDATEAVRLAVQRVGQNIFRASLLDYWGQRCAVSGLNIPELLRASHIKPWADCASDTERLDVFNGLLLAPHLDALFDGGWISFSDSGQLLCADALDSASRALLVLKGTEAIPRLTDRHRTYLAWHREHCFRNGR